MFQNELGFGLKSLPKYVLQLHHDSVPAVSPVPWRTSVRAPDAASSLNRAAYPPWRTTLVTTVALLGTP
jgi:hypothetical protein